MDIRIKALTDDEILGQIIKIIIKYCGKDVKIILFGSRAKGNYTKHSDFDIAIEKKGEIPFHILYKIEEELDMLPTLKSFDIVDLGIVDDDFKKLIKNTGRVIYERDNNSIKEI